MKKVLRRERDMISRYKIAVDLGYHDEIRDLRTREAGALILDKYGWAIYLKWINWNIMMGGNCRLIHITNLF